MRALTADDAYAATVRGHDAEQAVAHAWGDLRRQLALAGAAELLLGPAVLADAPGPARWLPSVARPLIDPTWPMPPLCAGLARDRGLFVIAAPDVAAAAREIAAGEAPDLDEVDARAARSRWTAGEEDEEDEDDDPPAPAAVLAETRALLTWRRAPLTDVERDALRVAVVERLRAAAAAGQGVVIAASAPDDQGEACTHGPAWGVPVGE